MRHSAAGNSIPITSLPSSMTGLIATAPMMAVLAALAGDRETSLFGQGHGPEHGRLPAFVGEATPRSLRNPADRLDGVRPEAGLPLELEVDGMRGAGRRLSRRR